MGGAGAGVRVGEMVPAADEVGGGGAGVVGGEEGVFVVGAFGGLEVVLDSWQKRKGIFIARRD